MGRRHLFMGAIVLVVLTGCGSADEASPTTTPAETTQVPATTVAPTTIATTAPTTTTTPSTTTMTTVPLGEELLAPLGPNDWETRARDGQTAEWVGEVLSLSGPIDELEGWPQAASTPVPMPAGTDFRLTAWASTPDDEGLLFSVVAFVDADGREFAAIGPGSWTVTSTEPMELLFDGTAPEGSAEALVIVRLGLNSALTDAEEMAVDVSAVSLRERG